MPKGVYSKIGCKNKEHEPFVPTQHQKDATKAFLKSPYKGMLLYHKLGSGKTCTSIMIMDKMLKKKKVEKAFILSPGSLRAGWVNEYCNVCGKDNHYLKKYVTFITYNYNVGDHLPSFRNSLVIIDEIHNLINGVKNQTKNATIIYNSLMESDCRILALSGTPVFNFVYEFAFIGNLLKPGGEFPEIRVEGSEELATGKFMNLFTQEPDGPLVPKNPTSFKRRMDGIVSYYPGAGDEYVPKLIEQVPIRVQAAVEQELEFWRVFDQENTLMLMRPNKAQFKNKEKLYKFLMSMYIMARKRILSRKTSNFYYPRLLFQKKDLTMETSLEKAVERYDDFVDPEKEKQTILKDDTMYSKGGWIKKRFLRDGSLYKLFSPKFTAVLTNIVLHDLQKHVLFTYYKTRSGVKTLKTLLNKCGITAGIFSGDLNDERRKYILKRFNSPENRHGDIIRVLLVTEAGAEGISVLEARHMHILESSTRMSKTLQAIGRVARFKSHVKLPEDERTIKIWRYWTVASPEEVVLETNNWTQNEDGTWVKKKRNKKIVDKRMIDERLYDEGMKTMKEIYSFLKLLQESSVTPY